MFNELYEEILNDVFAECELVENKCGSKYVDKLINKRAKINNEIFNLTEFIANDYNGKKLSREEKLLIDLELMHKEALEVIYRRRLEIHKNDKK